jgi:hypothetical protein
MKAAPTQHEFALHGINFLTISCCTEYSPCQTASGVLLLACVVALGVCMYRKRSKTKERRSPDIDRQSSPGVPPAGTSPSATLLAPTPAVSTVIQIHSVGNTRTGSEHSGSKHPSSPANGLDGYPPSTTDQNSGQITQTSEPLFFDEYKDIL